MIALMTTAQKNKFHKIKLISEVFCSPQGFLQNVRLIRKK